MQAHIINPKNIYHGKPCTIVSDGYGDAGPCECGHHRHNTYGYWVKFENLFNCEYFIPKTDILILNKPKEISFDTSYIHHPYIITPPIKHKILEKYILTHQINRLNS